jgi:hypothetical protein
MKYLYIILVFVLSACTTAMWNKPVALQDQADTYKFDIAIGGFGGEEAAFAKLQFELDKFESENGFTSHKIIDRDIRPFPIAKYQYTVRFMH